MLEHIIYLCNDTATKSEASMNYKKAIDTLRTTKTKTKSYSRIAKDAGINESGFYQSMAKPNPDFGWKQLLKISDALGVTFSRLARQAMKETGE